MVNSLGKKSEGDMPMYMKLVDGRWYANIRSRKNWKKKVTVSLDAYANEKRKATVNLGKVLADIERGKVAL